MEGILTGGKAVFTAVIILLSGVLSAQYEFGERQIFYDQDKGSWPDRIQKLAFDTDNDGDLDLVVYTTNQSGNIYQFENVDGDLGYYSRKHISSTEYMYDAAVGDVDNDGYSDILATYYFEKRIVMFKNLEGNGFSEAQLVLYFDGSIPRVKSIHLADIDNDESLDLLLGTTEGLFLCSGQGNGQFDTPILIAEFSDTIEAIHDVDLDNDGYLDLIIEVDYADRIYLLRNTGGAQFGEKELIGNAKSIDFYDWDNDGFTDMTFRTGDYVFLLLNEYDETTNTLTFNSSPILNQTGMMQIKVADYNHDGLADLFVTRYTADAKGIYLYENQGENDFSVTRTVGTYGLRANDLLVEDVNQDGMVYAVTTYYTSAGSDSFPKTSYYIYQQAEDNFEETDLEGFGGLLFSGRFEIDDFDGDGIPDLGYINDANNFWMKNYHNTKMSSQKFLSKSRTLIASKGYYVYDDFNGDGLKDFASSINLYQSMKIYKSRGNGLFEMIKTYDLDPGPGTYRNIFFLDIDGDGLKDLVFLSYRQSMSPLNKFKWIRNLDGEVFDEMENATDLIIDNNVNYTDEMISKIADINGDGKDDIVVITEPTYDYNIGWYENLDTGHFLRHQIMRGSQIPLFEDIEIADVNQDGKPDIISFKTPSNASSEGVGLFLNSGNGEFESIRIRDEDALHLVIKDIDNDGYPEIIGCQIKSTYPTKNLVIFVIKNDEGVFTDESIVDVIPGFAGVACSIGVMDLNGNSQGDIFMSDYYRFSYYLNESNLDLTEISNNGQSGIRVYPNPFSDYINWKAEREFSSFNIEIFDLTGRKIYAKSTSKTFLDLAFLKKGVYIINIENEGKTATYKIIKK